MTIATVGYCPPRRSCYMKKKPKLGPKHCGDWDLSTMVPEEKSVSLGFQAQTATVEIIYPPQRDTSIGSFWVVSLYF